MKFHVKLVSFVESKFVFLVLLLVRIEFNPLGANPTKWSNTLKQFVSNSRRIVWVCLIILWGWRLKGQMNVGQYILENGILINQASWNIYDYTQF